MKQSLITLLFLPLATLLQAETHVYVPDRYSLVFSSDKEAVLKIRPGDTVETTTIDSQGDDEKGRPIGPKYNALTGPFYIEGAKPGDVLVVHLDRVRLNSPRGLSYSGLSDQATTPREFAKGMAGGKLYHWNYAPATMTASTDLTAKLGRLRLPLRPFPGCVGVAPAEHEALSALYAGNSGGNLDYSQLGEGTTLYLPVNVDGAYFYIGDGHALQGDGELNGGAVETTLAVTFRVELKTQRQIPAVRAESADYYLALGVGDPLDKACQRATANMVDWLTTEFGLERPEAYVLIGMTSRLDIANVVNGRGNTVACKVPKWALRQVLGE